MSADFVIVVTAVLVVIPCAVLGSLLVLRQLAMMGDAISHAVLPGIVLAFFLTESLGPLVAVAGAGAFGLLTVLLVESLKNTGRIFEDSSIGIVFTALFALGVLLIARYGGNVHLDLNHVLYGEIAFAPLNRLNIGGVDLGPRSFWTLGSVTALAVAYVGLFYKELKVATFDPALAAAAGFSPLLLHYVLMGVVSVTVVGAFDSVGAILVVAFLVAPPATAYLLTERLSHLMLLATTLGGVAAVTGYYLSALADVSVSGTMASVAGALFVLALLLSPTRGLLVTAARRRRNHRVFTRGLLLSRLATQDGPVPDAELAGRLGWDPNRTARIVERATRDGLVQRPGPGRIALTASGRTEAERVAATGTA